MGVGTDLGYPRNAECICGSGVRFKHCCGKLGGTSPDDPPTWPTDKSLLDLLLEADQVGLEMGEEPKARSLKNIMRIAKAVRPGDGTILMGKDAERHITRAAKLMNHLYRRADIGIGALHIGAIMFRDIFIRVYVPLGVGILYIDPLEHSDLTSIQKLWLKSNTQEFGRFLDQYFDLWDFAFGWDDLQKRPTTSEEVRSYLTLAHFQLEAAAATVTTQCDFRGAVQSSLLSVELVLKAALLSTGVSEDCLKSDFGHDTRKILKYLEQLQIFEQANRIASVSSIMPHLVQNRYAATQPSRSTTGHILMGAQYIASVVTRALSSRNVRRENSTSVSRIYP